MASTKVEARTLTVGDAAKALGISRTVAYRMANEYVESGGEEGLPAIRLGKRLVVPKAMLDELLGDV